MLVRVCGIIEPHVRWKCHTRFRLASLHNLPRRIIYPCWRRCVSLLSPHALSTSSNNPPKSPLHHVLIRHEAVRRRLEAFAPAPGPQLLSHRACKQDHHPQWPSARQGGLSLAQQQVPHHRPRVRCPRRRRRWCRSARRLRSRRGRLQHCLHFEALPHQITHRRRPGWYQRRARKHAQGRLEVAHVRHSQGFRLAG